MIDDAQFPYMVFRAALMDVEPEAVGLPEDRPRSLLVSTAESRCMAITWAPPRAREGGLIDVSHCTAINTTDADGSWTLVVTSERPASNCRVIDYVPENACPQKGVVRGVREIINTIEHCALKQFVEEAFAQPDVFRYFWTCPGSIRHHHARAGGLAQHSLDVAQRIYHTTYDRPAHRDLGVAAGLLHDIGKVWAYADGDLTPEAARLGHEQLGFERLLPRILHLRDECRETGLAMQALLSGEWRRAHHGRAMAIGSLVKSADQFSAELDADGSTNFSSLSRSQEYVFLKNQARP